MTKNSSLLTLSLCLLCSPLALASDRCDDLMAKTAQVEEIVSHLPPHYTASEGLVHEAFYQLVEQMDQGVDPVAQIDHAVEVMISTLEQLGPEAQQALLDEVASWASPDHTDSAARAFSHRIQRGYYSQNPEIIRAIALSPLATLVDVNFVIRFQTPLLRAMGTNQLELVDALLDVRGIDMHKRNTYGANILFWIAEKGHNHLLSRIKIDGMDINAQLFNGSTAPMIAADHTNHEFLRYISDHPHLNLALQDKQGRRLLERAQASRHGPTVALVRNMMISKGLL